MRHSGDADKPRILGTFNEPMDNWLSFFMFTYFTGPGRQVPAQVLRRSGVRPAGAHHPLHADRGSPPHVRGRDGVGRVIKRTLEVMKELDTDDVATVREAGVIDLPTCRAS
jgi:benzoyl-CoA 2,3-dioxygenase component B